MDKEKNMKVVTEETRLEEEVNVSNGIPESDSESNEGREEKVIEAVTEEESKEKEVPSEVPASDKESPKEKVIEAVTDEESKEKEIPSEVPESEPKTPVGENDNYAFINGQIEKLIALKEEKNFTDFWFYVKELNKMIFVMKGVSRDDRVKFKDRINELCEDAKKTQEEIRVKVARTSGIKLDALKQILNDALAFGTTHDELEKSFQKIEEATRFLKEGKVKGEDGEESADMSREHRDEAKEAIKKAKDEIFDRKRSIREGNFRAVIEKLTKISDQLMGQGKPQKIFDSVKKLREEMKSMILDRPQLREIDNVIETIWRKTKEKLNAGRENDTQKRMSGLEHLVRKKEQFIQILEKEIKDLNLKWSGVKNDFFKNRVNEWIEEKKEKIEHTKKEIESTKEKIAFLAEQIKRQA